MLKTTLRFAVALMFSLAAFAPAALAECYKAGHGPDVIKLRPGPGKAGCPGGGAIGAIATVVKKLGKFWTSKRSGVTRIAIRLSRGMPRAGRVVASPGQSSRIKASLLPRRRPWTVGSARRGPAGCRVGESQEWEKN